MMPFFVFVFGGRGCLKIRTGQTGVSSRGPSISAIAAHHQGLASAGGYSWELEQVSDLDIPSSIYGVLT